MHSTKNKQKNQQKTERCKRSRIHRIVFIRIVASELSFGAFGHFNSHDQSICLPLSNPDGWRKRRRLHRRHLALTRSLCFWRLISLLHEWPVFNVQSKLLPSLELCKLRFLSLCHKHCETALYFSQGWSVWHWSLLKHRKITRSNVLQHDTTSSLQPLGSTPSAASNGWCSPAIERMDGAHSSNNAKCQAVVVSKRI